ncbi:neurotransmitter-gated ion-channel ligand binding domain-containing protein [Ditylenchus destructor]|nr:neurotransmitter-gated ion-channel ligand binding domain-containing protein [Ditylenchus destructor]
MTSVHFLLLFLILSLLISQSLVSARTQLSSDRGRKSDYQHDGKKRGKKRQHRHQPNSVLPPLSEDIKNETSETTTFSPLSTTDPIPWTDKQIVEELLKTYRFPDSSTNISVAVMLTVERILSSEHVDNMCRLQLLLTQKWMEQRLEFKHLRDSSQPVRLRSLSYIWNPALHIENALNVVPIGRDSLKVYSGGVVELIQRLQVITEAEADFRSFPFEKRNCSLVFSNDDSRAIWSRMLQINLPHDQPFTHAPTDFSATSGRMREYRVVEVKMKRQVVTWILLFFGPTTILLAIAWITSICFAPCYAAHPVAVLHLSLTSFAAIWLVVLFNNMHTPSTPYLKAVDFWNFAIIGSSLLTLIASTLRFRKEGSANSNILGIETHTYEARQNGKDEWSAGRRLNAQLSSEVANQMPYYTQLMSTTSSRSSYTRTLFGQLFLFIINISSLVVFIGFFVYFILKFVRPYCE